MAVFEATNYPNMYYLYAHTSNVNFVLCRSYEFNKEMKRNM